MKLKKKQSFTLIELMLVIFLIGIITAAVGYNMKGSLDKGKAFKTTQCMHQVKEILSLEMAENPEITAEQVKQNPKFYLERSGLVSNPEELLKDGWGQPLKLQIKKNGDITISSKKLEEYEAKKNPKKSKADLHEEDWENL